MIPTNYPQSMRSFKMTRRRQATKLFSSKTIRIASHNRQPSPCRVTQTSSKIATSLTLMGALQEAYYSADRTITVPAFHYLQNHSRTPYISYNLMLKRGHLPRPNQLMTSFVTTNKDSHKSSTSRSSTSTVSIATSNVTVESTDSSTQTCNQATNSTASCSTQTIVVPTTETIKPKIITKIVHTERYYNLPQQTANFALTLFKPKPKPKQPVSNSPIARINILPTNIHRPEFTLVPEISTYMHHTQHCPHHHDNYIRMMRYSKTSLSGPGNLALTKSTSLIDCHTCTTHQFPWQRSRSAHVNMFMRSHLSTIREPQSHSARNQSLEHTITKQKANICGENKATWGVPQGQSHKKSQDVIVPKQAAMCGEHEDTFGVPQGQEHLLTDKHPPKKPIRLHKRLKNIIAPHKPATGDEHPSTHRKSHSKSHFSAHASRK